MRRNMKRKTPVASIVVGILFVGMLGTTIYSVGEMRTMKREAFTQLDVLNEASRLYNEAKPEFKAKLRKDLQKDIERVEHDKVVALNEVYTCMDETLEMVRGMGLLVQMLKLYMPEGAEYNSIAASYVTLVNKVTLKKQSMGVDGKTYEETKAILRAKLNQ